MNVFLCVKCFIIPDIVLPKRHAEVSSSVLSDHSTGLERKTRTELAKLFCLMFGADAFREDVDPALTHRKIEDNFEIDFCSTIHIHEGLHIRDRPVQQMAKFRFLRGNWDSWLTKIIRKHKEVSSGHEQPGRKTPQSDLTEVMTSVRATHYIVCETKISEGQESVKRRLAQLNRNLKKLCQRKGATNRQAPFKALGIIALAGIGVPRHSQFSDKYIKDMIKKSKGQWPVLHALWEEERVFVFEVETFHVRLEQLEEGQAKLEEGQAELKEGQAELKEGQARLEKMMVAMLLQKGSRAGN
jgi:hypothetical protein